MLTQMLQAAAARPEGRRAFQFRTYHPGQDASQTKVCSFAELACRAMANGRRIAQATQVGDRVLILAEPGLPHHLAFFGCLLAGVIPVPLPEPITRAQVARVEAAARDCAASFAVVGGESAPRAAELAHTWRLPSIHVELDKTTGDFARARSAQYHDVAYLQYTSGSTGNPKGIIVRDDNLAHNLALIEDRLALSAADRIVSFLPPHHDMGLVVGLLLPLFCDADTLIMRACDFAAAPERWLTALTEFRATMSVASNFAYDLCTVRVPVATRATLDLSSIRLLISGAEPIRASSVLSFFDAFMASGLDARTFVSGYGLAEATLVVSLRESAARQPLVLTVDRVALGRGQVSPSTAPDAAALVSCGAAGAGVAIRIVDPETQAECAEGLVGEVWTASRSVCRGVWGKEAPHLVRRLEASTSQVWLRSGDLGFLHGGELFITGRIKDVINISGVNLHPEDLEASVEVAHVALRVGGCVVFGVEGEHRARIVVVCEMESTEARALADAIFVAVSARLYRTHLLRPDEILLVDRKQISRTTSGKFARAACREAYLHGRFAVHERWPRSAP